MKLFSPAAARNAPAIADVLARWLPPAGIVLEVASGTGEHALHLARAFPHLIWQPSDPDAEARASICAWQEEAGSANLREPLALDAAAETWPLDRADAVLCINMVHISPWAATTGLLAGVARLLPAGAPLILYGPFRRTGIATAASNEAFDASLKARNTEWGLRSVEDVAAAAGAFSLADMIEMPANNLMLLFRRETNRPRNLSGSATLRRFHPPSKEQDMATNSGDVAVLNTLLSTVYDSVRGYEESSRDVDSQSVKTLFHEGAKERAQVAHLLRDEVVRLGGEPTDSPSMLGTAHQAFMKLREMVSAREDKAIIEEVERGEDYIKEKFETAIGNTDLSPSTLDVVQRAYTMVKQGHDRARDLKRSINA